MIPLPAPLKVSMSNATKMLLKRGIPDHLNFIIVKDGVANMTDSRFYLRMSIDIPDGYYQLTANESGWGLNKVVPDLMYNGVLNTGIDPEILRPNFETMQPLCVIEKPLELLMQIVSSVITVAVENDDKVAIDKTGIGLKKDGAVYFEYPFNIPEVIYLDPYYAHAAFTDAMRHPTIALYMETGHQDKRPLTPLVIGYGWKNCSLVFPIPDNYRHMYSR